MAGIHAVGIHDVGIHAVEETKRNRKKQKVTERNRNIQKEPRILRKLRCRRRRRVISVFRSSVRSHASHAIGELKKNKRTS
jgi:hypothetical protein